MARWVLQTASRLPRGASSMTLDLEVNSAGVVNGTLTYTMGNEGEAGGLIVDPPGGTYNQQTTTYTVQGGWVASYSGNQPNKKFSVFAVQGNDGADLPTFLAADGTMTGPGDKPTAIRIKVNTASSQYGTLTQDTLSLYPSQA